MAAAGGRYVFAVAPNTHSIYPEHLPDGIESAPRRPVHQLIEHLESCGSPVRVLYPDAELRRHKKADQLFLRVDTHWTDRGAFLVYRFLIDALDGAVALRDLTEDDLYYIERTITGDLGSKLDPPREEVRAALRVSHHASHPVYDNCVEGTGSVIVTDCEPAPPDQVRAAGRLVLVRPAEVLSGDVSAASSFVQRPTIPDDLIESERPDVVMSVMAERFLTRLPLDDDGPTQSEVEPTKRAAGRVRAPQAPYGPRTRPRDGGAGRSDPDAHAGTGGLRDAAIVSLMAYATLGPQDVLRCAGPTSARTRSTWQAARVPLWPVVAEDLRAWRDAVHRRRTTTWWSDWATGEAGAKERYAPAVDCGRASAGCVPGRCTTPMCTCA